MATTIVSPTNLGPRRLLDVPTAAECTGLTHRTIRRIVDERRLPVVKVGRAVRVWSDDLAAYLDANTQPAREGAGK